MHGVDPTNIVIGVIVAFVLIGVVVIQMIRSYNKKDTWK